MRKTFRSCVLASGVVALSLAMLPSAASASHSWNGYHWARQSNPFTVKLGNNLNSTWSPILSTTSSDWTSSSVLNTTIVAGGAGSRQCRATLGMVEVCNNTYGNNGWLGIASVSISGSHITQGTVKLNDTYFSLSRYNTPAWRNMVTCQEIGHTFGLDHVDTNQTNPNLGTCMDYTNNPSTNQYANQHDFDMLASIYSHRDGYTTVGATPRARAGVTGIATTQGIWGARVSGSRAQGASTYVRTLRDGSRQVTFVIWTG